MPKLRSINLRFWLPMLTVLIVLVMESTLFYRTHHQTKQQIFTNAKVSSRQIAKQLVSIVELQSIGLGVESVRDVLTPYLVNLEIRWLILVDEYGTIQFSNRIAWEGGRLEQHLPEDLSRVSVESVMSARQELVHQGQEPGRIIYYLPVSLGTVQGTLRKQRLGLLIFSYDFSLMKARALKQAFDRHIFELVVLLGLAVLVAFSLHFFVVRPIHRLALAAEDLGRGNFNTRLNVEGQGDIALLANAFNRMASKLEEQWASRQEREQFLETTLNSIGDAVIVTDDRGRVTQMNSVAETLTGWTSAEAIHHPLHDVFKIYNAMTGKSAGNPIDTMISESRVVGLANHTILRGRSGREYQIADSAAPIRMNDNSPLLGVILVFRDVTEEYALQDALKNQHDRLASIVRTMPDIGFILDEEGRYVDIFGGDEHLLYEQRDALLGEMISDVLPYDVASKIMATIRDSIRLREPRSLIFILTIENRKYWFEGRCAPMETRFDNCNAVIWISRDITKQKQAEERIHNLAYFDELTGLPNRAAFHERLGQEISRVERNGIYAALLFFDLDHFKDVNDSLGHDVGDEVLRVIAKRCHDVLRAEDVFARLAGDEFVVLLAGLSDELQLVVAEAGQVAEKILGVVSEPITYGQHFINLAASVGITLFPQAEGSTIHDLMKQADTAMYRAKEEGRNRVRYFSPNDQKCAHRRFELTSSIQRSIENNELSLFLQPIIDEHGYCNKAEALMRWNHTQLGLVSPSEFIPIAESTGFILKLGAWAIDQGAQILARVNRHLGRDSLERLAINLSPAQFLQPDFVKIVTNALERNQVNPTQLTLELTEDILISQPVIVHKAISELRHGGMHFSIDDFGTGYSSLQYLTTLPLDTLKIDRAFIRDAQVDSRDLAVVDAIIQMAKSMSLNVIAEGVETDQQLSLLRNMGCHEFQGFYFAGPMPEEEFIEYLEQQNT